MVGQDNIFDRFSEAWDVWKKPVLDYASSSYNKPARLQHALRDLDSNDEGKYHYFIMCTINNCYILSFIAEAEALTVLRCLAYFFIPNSRKKRPDHDSNNIPHLVMEGKVSARFRFPFNARQSCFQNNYVALGSKYFFLFLFKYFYS